MINMKDNATPFVSVVIPVWNPGPGISRCIESLRNQTLKEIEMIFVDDCGTDDSMDKVRAAAAEDSRIRILENESNIGPGPSRNKGIEAAKGEYLSFVDADDYLAPDFLELLYAETRNQSLDIAKGSMVREQTDGSAAENSEITNQNIRHRLSMGAPLFGCFRYEHQSAIYRYDLIHASNIRYGLSRRGQDVTFLLQVCSQAKLFSIVDAAHYHYCERWNATVHTVNASMLQGVIQSVHEQVDYVLRKLLEHNAVQEYMENRFLYIIRELERFSDTPELKTVLSDAVNNLRLEWMRLPFHDDSAKKSFPLYVLQKHSSLLPLEPYYYFAWESSYPPVRYAQLVERWVDYYLNNPKEANACQKDLSKVIGRAKVAVKGKPYNTYSTEEQSQGKRLLNVQLARLSILLRVKIGLASIKPRLVHILPAKFIQSLKRLRKFLFFCS